MGLIEATRRLLEHDTRRLIQELEAKDMTIGSLRERLVKAARFDQRHIVTHLDEEVERLHMKIATLKRDGLTE